MPRMQAGPGTGARRAFLPCLREELPHPERDSDFIVVTSKRAGTDPARRRKEDSRPLLDFMASVYETWVYPAVGNLYGGWHSTSLNSWHMTSPTLCDRMTGLF